MSLIHPEEHFRRGLHALSAGKHSRAASLFFKAMEQERHEPTNGNGGRYLSYYGFSLSLAHRPKREFVSMCEEAVEQQPDNPELLGNLAKVYLLAGLRTRALETLMRGLENQPNDKRLKALLAKFDRRRRPVIPGLTRDHPLNRAAGRVRHRLSASD